MIPKARLDALTDGIFAFAMTLLVLDLRLPDGFNPQTATDLLNGLSGLSGQLLAYVISFFVLGARWLGMTRAGAPAETVGGGFSLWMLAYLFFITCMPFSTMVIGRYGDLPPAVWLYAANMIVPSFIWLRIAPPAKTASGWLAATILIASAALSVAISFVSPSNAMYAYLLNLLPRMIRWVWPGSRAAAA